jgi:hypothetical protein
MSSRPILLLLTTAAYFIFQAYGHPQFLPTDTNPIPFHTAIYTTVLKSTADGADGQATNLQREWITTAVVTVMMPREEPLWPKNGGLVLGTGISSMDITYQATPAQAGPLTSSWKTATTEMLTWTLSGNADTVSPRITAAPQAIALTLTSIFTTTTHVISEYKFDFVGRLRDEWFTTSRITLVEVVGTAYPTSITRTGYTNVDMTYIATNQNSVSPLTTTYTKTYLRTTTMVQS